MITVHVETLKCYQRHPEMKRNEKIERMNGTRPCPHLNHHHPIELYSSPMAACHFPLP